MDERQIRLFVGPRAEYYLDKWGEVNYTSRRNTWSWGGFFFSIFWLAYRKMFTLCSIFSVLALVLISACVIAQCRLFAITTLALGFQIIIGYFGNRMYFHFVQAKLLEIYALGVPEKPMLKIMVERGGTEFAAVIALVFVLAIIVYSLLLLLNAVPDFFLPSNLFNIIFSV